MVVLSWKLYMLSLKQMLYGKNEWDFYFGNFYAISGPTNRPKLF